MHEDKTAHTAMKEMHRYIEWIISHYKAGATSWSGDVAKFYGEFILTSAVAIMVENDRLDEVDEFLSLPIIMDDYGGLTAKSVSFSRASAFLRSLQARDDRLQLRRLSLHADLIKQVCELSGFSFRSFMQADLLLFLRASVIETQWWPDSLLYASDADGSFPWYLRAVTPQRRDAFLKAMAIPSKSKLEWLIEQFRSGQLKSPEWSGAFSRTNAIELANLQGLLDSFTS